MSDSWQGLTRTTYKWLLQPDWNTTPSMSTNFNRTLTKYDFTGVDLYELSANYPLSIQYGYTNLTKEDEYKIINLFNTRKGRLKRFWLPMWKNEFKLVSAVTAGDNILTVNNTFWRKIDQGYERIFIQLKNGDYISRKISAVIQDGANENIILETTINRDIALSDVKYFSRLLLVRLDDDNLNMNYQSHLVSDCTLNFFELVDEYAEEES